MSNIQENSASGNFDAETGTPMVMAATGPQMPAPLTTTDEAELLQLQGRVRGVEASEGSAVKKRALLLRGQYRFAHKHGPISLAAHAKSLGFDYDATTLAYHLAAQLLLNKNVSAAAKDDKEAIQSEASQLARAIAAMEQGHVKHDGLSDDEFVLWYSEKGRISGLAKSYLTSKRQDSASNSHKADAEPVLSPDKQVEAIFDNPAAVEIDTPAGIPTGQEGLFMYRQEGDKLRLIPLTAPQAKLIELAGLAPDPLTNAAKDLLFHRQMLLAGEAFVPDEMSGVTVEDVPVGDVANDTYTMLPANGTYLVEQGHISIAHARRDDGLIVQVSPKDVDPGYALIGEKYLDNRTRRRLGAALLGEADAAQFALSAVDGVAAKISGSGKSRTLTFTHKASGAKVNLIVKPRNMGTIWTYRVSSAFAPTAQAVMDDTAVANFDATFVKALLKKQPERVVTVAIGEGGIGFANGKAAPLACDAAITGTAKAQVLLSDLRRAAVGLLALPVVGGLTWKLDPNGLLLVEASSEVARFEVFIQTLEANRDQPTRERKLRERVESLSQPAASNADAA